MMGCRLCAGRLDTVLDFGMMPLANRYRKSGELLLEEPRYPLALTTCAVCHHVQLSETVPPDVLYTERPYLYRSGVSRHWQDHCAELARELPLGNNQLAIDIGSNDGTLLGALSRRGYWVMGVDPSAELNELHPYASVEAFWSREVADWVMERMGLRPSVITATNVFAHIDDPIGFLQDCKSALDAKGQIIIECPSLLSMVQNGTFDQVYHEHIHYWSPASMDMAARFAGLALESAKPLGVHGGSFRYRLRHDGRSGPWLIKPHLGKYADQVVTWMEEWTERLIRWRDDGKIVWGYGASAKGMTILNACPVLEAVTRIVDDNEAKQGWYTPGLPIPIRPPIELDTADILINFAANWKDEIEPKIRASGFAGEIVYPF